MERAYHPVTDKEEAFWNVSLTPEDYENAKKKNEKNKTKHKNNRRNISDQLQAASYWFTFSKFLFELILRKFL